MGVITVLVGWGTYQLAFRAWGYSRMSLSVGGAIGAWVSVIVSATACAIELALSGTSPFWIAFPAMVGVHTLIGFGEAAITVGALALIAGTRPDLLRTGEAAYGKGVAAFASGGLVVAIAIAAFSFMASPSPDGLERVAADTGFFNRAQTPLFNILPDYTIPFVTNETVSGIVAVVVGTIVVFGIAFAVGLAMRRARVASRASRT
jgi:cobalt/nickel transport system permease protein